MRKGAYAPQACGWHIHTALVERINLNLRQRVAVLGRRRATPCTGEDGLRQPLMLGPRAQTRWSTARRDYRPPLHRSSLGRPGRDSLASTGRYPGSAPAYTGVVYTTAADNSRSTRIRYNALISPLSVGALPWYHPSFSTNSGLSLWCGSSSCSAGWARTPPLSGVSRSRHRSPSDASAPLHPKRLRA
jgi:hypothetical protein